MSRLRWLWLLPLAVACHKREPDQSAALPAATSTSGPRVVTVDPALVREGRIRTDVAVIRPPRGEAWIPGEITPGEQGAADVTALASGRVATLDCALGEAVKRGQVVATIDSPEAGKASADLLRARGRALLASRALARQLDLDGQGATSRSAVDEARAEDAAARADLLAARTLLAGLGGSEPASNVEGAATALAPTRLALRAPIDGVITARTVSLGTPVTPDKAILHIVAKSSRIAIGKMPETLGAVAAPGTRVRLRARSASTDTEPACEATLISSLGVVDDARTVGLRFLLDPTCASFAAGRFVELALPSAGSVDAGALLLVPTSAVIDVRGASVVFVRAGSDDSFEARAVRVGSILGPDASLESGVVQGERVVVEGGILLKGELVKAELQ